GQHVLATVALHGPRSFDFLKVALEAADALAQDPAVRLELRFTLAAAHSPATLLAREVTPLARQPWQLIVELGELDLGTRLATARALIENLEDHAAAILHRQAEDLLEVLGLAAGEVVVEQDHVGAQALRLGADALRLAAADVERGVGRRPP